LKGLFTEFKDFISRGSAIDLAIGIIIGGAFSAVVNSIVDNLLMPPLGLLLGNVDFQDLFIVLRHGEQALPPNPTLEMAKEVGAVTFNYGQFLTDLLSFIILGFGVFLIVKAINKLRAVTDAEEDQEPQEPTEKDCPYCKISIPVNATRCPFCTSQLTEAEE
jgi:large conductance mechanosensitive channel